MRQEWANRSLTFDRMITIMNIQWLASAST